MDRRTFLKLSGACVAPLIMGQANPGPMPLEWEDQGPVQEKGFRPMVLPDAVVKDRLAKSRLYDHWFADDILLSQADLALLGTSLERLKRIQGLVGHGNFSLISFDQALACAKGYGQVGPFTRAELDFLEQIFCRPARDYGFMGEKPIQEITGTVDRARAEKIAGTGQYLYQGRPKAMYTDIQKKIGGDAVLTSGIRSVVKQFLLFLDKAGKHQGNLSLASRSLAPPGYSFHGVGDFDVGERGFGVDNFTEKFTQTRVYNQLTDLGFVKFRYDRFNDLGVRFEPWHVEVG